MMTYRNHNVAKKGTQSAMSQDLGYIISVESVVDESVRLTVGAAEVIVAPGGVSRARLGLSVRDGDETVRARVERAERLAALGHLATVAVAERGLSIRDGDEAVRAADGVAEQIAALGHRARVTVAFRVLGVVDGSEAVGAPDGVAVQRLRHK